MVGNLTLGVVMRVTMAYTASNRTLTTSIVTNGIGVAAIDPVHLSGTFSDFRVGTFAIESYNDAGQDPQFGGSLLAHGSIGNVMITLPEPPVRKVAVRFVAGQWQVTFGSRTNWSYTLQRTADLQSWTAASAAISGNGGNLMISDTNSPQGGAYFRVSAQRP